MTFKFEIVQNEMEAMAKFVSELVRQGVTFSVDRDAVFCNITLTGGY